MDSGPTENIYLAVPQCNRRVDSRDFSVRSFQRGANGAGLTTSGNDEVQTCISRLITPTSFRPLPARRLKSDQVGGSPNPLERIPVCPPLPPGKWDILRLAPDSIPPPGYSR
jgi:hypothetical protein